MLSIRSFWRRHKTKIFVAAGVIGSGYALYTFYNAHKRRIFEHEEKVARDREEEEVVNAQIQAHFENVQRIADSITVPSVLINLATRIEEELNLSQMTERLQRAKDQQDTLAPSEKYDLWEKLKILSFTKTVVSIWTMTTLCLYIRVQVNILGRHLYIDTARGLGNSVLLDDAEFDRDDQEKFLATSDFLVGNGLSSLIPKFHEASAQVLKRKDLRDIFNTAVLQETIMQIFNAFVSTGNPHHWVHYLIPQDNNLLSITQTTSGNENTSFPNLTKFDQLMLETRGILVSAEFRNIVETSFQIVVNALTEDLDATVLGIGHNLGVPLAKLIPIVAKLGPSLFDEPRKSQFIQIINNVPQVEQFFTLLYSSMPAS